MPAASYERYGLTGNPFRDLASENVADVELLHVNLELDTELRRIKDETWDRENKAVVGLVGGHGAGKTQRLLVTSAEARDRKAFLVYFDVPSQVTGLVPKLAVAILAAAPVHGFAKVFSPPSWHRELSAVVRAKPGTVDMARYGRAIAGALNALAPSALLLNDLHNVPWPGEAPALARALEQLADDLKPGVLVMFGCFPEFNSKLSVTYPAMASRINRTFYLPTLSPAEAALLLAKKLLAKRVVEGMDPTYPFDRESVAEINEASLGNPRRLVELADRALEYGVSNRLYRLDRDAVRKALQPVRPTDAPPTAATGVVRAGAPSGAGPTPAPAVLASPAKAPVARAGRSGGTRAPVAPPKPSGDTPSPIEGR
jgi:hypothetical protein